MIVGIILTALLGVVTLGGTGNMEPKYETKYERSIYDD